MRSSIGKTLDYIAKVSKKPVIVDNTVFTATGVDQVIIKENFFLRDGCEMCGRCCVNANTAYTKSQLKMIENTPDSEFIKLGLDPAKRIELYKGIVGHKYIINGKEKTMYAHPKDMPRKAFRINYPDRPNIERCHWLFEVDGTYRCYIHPVRALTCRIPHIKFWYSKATNRTSLSVSQFGRNWALGCPVEFGPPDEESTLNRIKTLKMLLDSANDLEVETFLPEIIHYLESGGRQPRTFTKVKRRKLF